jgi:hypothetical protein
MAARLGEVREEQTGGLGAWVPEWLDEGTKRDEETWQSALLRDLFGNPFCPVPSNPSWRTPTIIGLAEELYTTRCFERMPEMAAALEEAGCGDERILDHCRGPGPHARGCWVLDLVRSVD